MDPKKLFLEAMNAINAGDYGGARQTLLKVNGMAPGNADVLSYLGFAEASLGMPEGLAKTAKAAEASPKSPQILMNHAFALTQSGHQARAIEVLKQAHLASPNLPPILNQLSRLLVADGAFAEAESYTKILVGQDPKNPVFAARYVKVLVGLNKGEEAYAFVKGLEKILPQNRSLLELKAGAARAAQNWPESYRLYKKLSEEDPASISFKRGLAHSLLGLEDFSTLVPVLKEIRALDPDNEQVIYSMAFALFNDHRHEECRPFVEQILSRDPEHVDALIIKGRSLIFFGEFEAAEKIFLKILELSPDHPMAVMQLTKVFQKDFSTLVPVLKEIRALDPDNEQVIYSMAFALFNDHRHEECRPFVEQILSRDPEHVDALIIKGRSLIFFGEFEAAEKIFLKILELSPDHPMAVMQLTKVRRPTERDATFDKIEEMEKTTTDEHDYRALMGYTLGEMYEGIKDYDKAFHFFQLGNERAKSRFAKRGFGFDPDKTKADFDQIKKLYSKENLGALKGTGSSSQVPIFIVAMPRSGTTLLEQVVSSHSKVYGGGELPLGNAAAQKLKDDLGQATPENLKEKLGTEARDYAHLYLDYLPERGPGETRLSDKMPNNFMHLGFLQTVLPKASYIYIKRHPLDICLSIYKGFFGSGFTYALDLEDLGFYYRQHHDLMAYWRGALALPMLEVRYEEFVADPEGEGRRVLEHCGLEWQPACLEFHKRKNKVITMSAIQVREPVHQKAVDKWRRYEKHLDPLLRGLGDDIVKTLDL